MMQQQSLFKNRDAHFYSKNRHSFVADFDQNLETKAVYVNMSLSKKLFDIGVSFLLLILVFSWLFPLIGLLIKLNSQGPVFFVQKRIGLNGHIFKCFKFRTMRIYNVKYMYTPTDVGDPRITKVGSFLRRTNMDELPQFINVLLGHMSIVGPRPHAIPFHQIYSSFIEDIDARHLIKPGITGLAQIKGYRGDVKDFDENRLRTRTRIKFDMQYIRIWSLHTDFWIVYTTLVQMLGRKTNGH